MKTRIFCSGVEIFTSNKISAANLEKKVAELRKKHDCQTMPEKVRKGFNVFCS